MKSIAIFASGGGSNASKIIEYFGQHDNIQVSLIITNNEDASVVKIARTYYIPSLVISKKELNDEAYMLSILNEYYIDFIILAGFLLLIPSSLIKAYHNKIINIHPSLLPKYGGKGMYGMHVHKAVVEACDTISGLTIHLVNEEYDRGRILAQIECPLQGNETPEAVAALVLKLEHQYFAPTIEQYILSNINGI